MTDDSGIQEFEGATFVGTSFKAHAEIFDLVGDDAQRDVDRLDIDGHDLLFGSLFVNGVDVVPFVDAELNREPQPLSSSRADAEAYVTSSGRRAAAWATTSADTPAEIVDAHVDDSRRWPDPARPGTQDRRLAAQDHAADRAAVPPRSARCSLARRRSARPSIFPTSVGVADDVPRGAGRAKRW